MEEPEQSPPGIWRILLSWLVVLVALVGVVLHIGTDKRRIWTAVAMLSFVVIIMFLGWRQSRR
jgi:hypothetical protein